MLASTSDRLRFVALSPFDAGGILSIDRARNRAVVGKYLSILPVGRARIALTDIRTVEVQKQERSFRSTRYGIVIRASRGDDLRFWCGSRGRAMRIMRDISQFLARK